MLAHRVATNGLRWHTSMPRRLRVGRGRGSPFISHMSYLVTNLTSLRLLTFVISVRGALGPEAQTFIRQLSARVAGAVPYRLLDEASWAT